MGEDREILKPPSETGEREQLKPPTEGDFQAHVLKPPNAADEGEGEDDFEGHILKKD